MGESTGRCPCACLCVCMRVYLIISTVFGVEYHSLITEAMNSQGRGEGARARRGGAVDWGSVPVCVCVSDN